MKNALHSMYGEGHANATRTRECVAMPGVREQRVLTPQPIVDALLRFWPDGVAYDPAGAPVSLVGAEVSTMSRGLIDPWPDRTFCNPPYGDSLWDPEKEAWPYIVEMTIRERCKRERPRKPVPKSWWPEGLPLKKAGLGDWLQAQLRMSRGESIMLVPNRTHRKWFREWKLQLDSYVELDPIAFVGAKSPAPFPLMVGLRLPQHRSPTYHTDRVLDFEAAFSDLGDSY